jgi:membrane fusion protein (multidrug efflux system)
MSSPENENQPEQRRISPRKGLVRVILLALAPIVAVLAGGYFYVTGGRIVSTENAYVKADKVAVSTDVDGRVIQVSINDNQPIRAGQLLFRLDPEPFRISLEEAEANMRTVGARIEATRAQLRQKHESLNMAEVDISYMRREFERQRQLVEKGHASKAKYDAAMHNLELAQQGANEIREAINEVIANLAGDPNIAIEKHPTYLEAKSIRDEVALALRRTEIYAPIDGIATRMTLQPGEYVEAGEPIFSIVETDKVWVEANLKETELTYVVVGQEATIKVDAYPGVVWLAEIESISPATGAEFSLLPPQNATGNWVKVVQRIPVKLKIQEEEGMPALRAGMSVRVEIDTLHEREMPSLLRSALGWIRDEEG